MHQLATVYMLRKVCIKMAEPEDSKPVACTRPDSPSAFLFDTKYLAKKYGVPEGLSKRQTKKLIKKHKKEEYKAEWRKAKRDREKERKKKKLKAKGGEPGFFAVRKHKRMMDKEASGVTVAVDVGYEELMSDADIVKLTKQLQRCYSQNRRADHPLQFHITSFGGKCKARLDEYVEGYKQWDVYFKEEKYVDVFDKEKIVFLCAESPNVLEEVDPNKIYIIGGLVDHNHHKGYCYKQATEQGLSHAQLPIGKYVLLNSRKVLTINHVFEILVSVVNNGGNWKEAFYSILPPRKLEATPPEGEPHPLLTAVVANTTSSDEETHTSGLKGTESSDCKMEDDSGTGGTSGTGGISRKGDISGTRGILGTRDTSGTGDTLSIGRTLRTEGTLDSVGSSETGGTLRSKNPCIRYTAGVRIYAPNISLAKENEQVVSDNEEVMPFTGLYSNF